MSTPSQVSREIAGAGVPESPPARPYSKVVRPSRFSAADRIGTPPPQEIQVARELIDRGALSQAEERLRRLIERRGAASLIAEARCALSIVLEAQSRNREALEAVAMYELPAAREAFDFDTAMHLRVQIAAAYKAVGDHPKAIALLQSALRDATELPGADSHLGAINAKLANVYRSLNEFRIARDYSHKAIAHLRQSGDWRELANAYRGVGLTDIREGRYEDACRSFEQVIRIVGDEIAPHLLAMTYSTLAGACWVLRRPHEGIAYLEKALGYYEGAEHKMAAVTCYNNLGLNLMLIGDWARAEQVIEQGLALARTMQGRNLHVITANQYDSLAELCLLRGDIAQARRYLDEAQELIAESGHEWYAGQFMRTSSRCLLAMRDPERALAEAQRALEVGVHIGDRQANCSARLLIAEAQLQLGRGDECRRELREIEAALTATAADLPLIGDVQRLYGRLAADEGDSTLAAHHFHRYLAICEMADDRYHTAQAHAELGYAYAVASRPHRAAHHLAHAAHAFRLLGAKADLPLVEQQLKRLDLTRPDIEPDPATVANLLTLRLADASASRDLLLRDLAAICYAETCADAVLIVEAESGKDDSHLVVAHGSTDVESSRLATELWAAWKDGEAESFAARHDACVVTLAGGEAPPALVLITPKSVALGTQRRLFDALTRVAELGLEAYALRNRAHAEPDAETPRRATNANVMPGFIHTSPAMTRLVEEAHKIRSSGVTVLVTGESGTGKELVARLVHTLSERRDKTFVPFNCTAVPKELSEAYLFGYKRGAFTGATSDSPGVIRAAEGGTLFLDEVGDLPLDVQPKLLRFLQEGEVQPLGEQRPLKVDVRVVAATNNDLERAVAEGRFREDLYYRLNVIRLLVPPLRERRAEIPPLINHYVEHYAAKFGRRGLRVSEQAMELLTIAEWGGNVRQLCNEVQRLVARAEDDSVIAPEHLSPELRRAAPHSSTPAHLTTAAAVIPIGVGATMLNRAMLPEQTTLADAVGDLERRMIADAMQRHAGNISRVARELGLTRRGLYLKLERYNFDVKS